MENYGHASNLIDIVKLTKWNIPDQIRALWRIPLKAVIEAMDLKWEDVADCEWVHHTTGDIILIRLNPLTNDWCYEHDEHLTYDHFEAKSSIDLAMLLSSNPSLECAVAFLLEKFPQYRIAK